MSTICKELSEGMLRSFVARYERDEVQSTPRLRFVDAEGRACPAAALCDARSSADFARAAGERGGFLGGPLERVSRLFEAGRLRPAELYTESVLELTRRRAERTARHGSSGRLLPARA